jgi:hypothetical protein
VASPGVTTTPFIDRRNGQNVVRQGPSQSNQRIEPRTHSTFQSTEASSAPRGEELNGGILLSFYDHSLNMV